MKVVMIMTVKRGELIMSKYISYFGGEFEDYEDAREDMYETIELDDYIEGLKEKISFDSLLRYCWAHGESFWEEFEDEIYAVEEDFFRTHYHEVKDEDEDEDC